MISLRISRGRSSEIVSSLVPMAVPYIAPLSGCGLVRTAVRTAESELDGKGFLKSSNKRPGELFDSWSFSQILSSSSHLALEKRGVLQAGGTCKGFAITCYRHGSMLQE